VRSLAAVAVLALAAAREVSAAQVNCTGCQTRQLPAGEGPGGPTPGSTALRLNVQVATGDKVFAGTQEVLNPPVTADIEWHRTVAALDVFHQFTSHLGAGLSLPVYEQEIRNRTTGEVVRAAGPGDLVAYALWNPWAEAGPRGLWSLSNLSFYAGLSVPTGDPLAGEVPALHGYHLGSASVEFKLGAKYFAAISESFTLTAAFTAVVDGGADTNSFRFGNSYDLQLGAAAEPVDDLWFFAAAYVNFREKDHLSNLRLPDTGGAWIYLEAGVAVRVAGPVVLDFSAFVPVYWDVNGVQPVSDVVWSGGLRVRL
jgi:hypothetical protein